ncbi:MAG: hypothetical protein ACRC1P_10995 [Cellulosilyticaceae bacterium]
MDDGTIIERLTRVEERSKSNTHQIEEVKTTVSMIHDINTNMAVMLTEMKDIREDNRKSTDEIKTDMKSMKTDMSVMKKDIEKNESASIREKANSFDKIKWQVITFVIASILGILAGIVIK